MYAGLTCKVPLQVFVDKLSREEQSSAGVIVAEALDGVDRAATQVVLPHPPRTGRGPLVALVLGRALSPTHRPPLRLAACPGCSAIYVVQGQTKNKTQM